MFCTSLEHQIVLPNSEQGCVLSTNKSHIGDILSTVLLWVSCKKITMKRIFQNHNEPLIFVKVFIWSCKLSEKNLYLAIKILDLSALYSCTLRLSSYTKQLIGLRKKTYVLLQCVDVNICKDLCLMCDVCKKGLTRHAVIWHLHCLLYIQGAPSTLKYVHIQQL